MVFNRFRLHILIRLLFILLTVCGLFYLFLKGGFEVTCVGLLVLLGAQFYFLLKFIESAHCELNAFLDSLLVGDYTRKIKSHHHSVAHQELNEKYNSMQSKFLDLRQKNEELVRYYTLLLEKVPVALIIVDGEELSLVNIAAQKLFQRNRLDRVDYLHQFGDELAEDIRQIMPGEQRKSQLIMSKTTTSLTLSAATLQLSGGVKKVVSLSPIQRELDRQEMSAWQNLVQVFTHEIMNSMTPVASLSKTAAALLEDAKSNSNSEVGQGELIDDAHQAIEIVARRADNLMGFVQAYRRIENSPIACRNKFELKKLLSGVCLLFAEQAKSKHIHLHYSISPENIELNADFAQVEQAVINIVKNALESIEGANGGEVSLSAYIGEAGNIVVDIVDNGCGISSEKLEQVFVPFYTSKREGTGIGLFLVKQIMQAHLGSVYAARVERGGTLIRLVF